MALPSRKILIWFVVGLACLTLAALLASFLATRSVKQTAQAWLGPNGQAARIDVGWNRVRLHDVHIDTPKGWPGEQSFKARYVDFHPTWRTLLSDRLEISSIDVTAFELTALRKRAGGIDVLPSLREYVRSRADATPDDDKRGTRIGAVTFKDGVVDFYDAQVMREPHRIRIENVQARIGPLEFPEKSARTDVEITGRFAGKGGGTLKNTGWLILGSQDADMQTTLTQVPITPFLPYLQRSAELAFKGGRLDMNLDAKVRKRQINAQGKLTLTDLTLADSGLLSLPRKAAIAALEDSQGRAQFDFTLEGPLGKPRFKMEDNLSMRVAGGLAGVLGLSIEGLAGSLGDSVEAIGNALGELSGVRSNAK